MIITGSSPLAVSIWGRIWRFTAHNEDIIKSPVVDLGCGYVDRDVWMKQNCCNAPYKDFLPDDTVYVDNSPNKDSTVKIDIQDPEWFEERAGHFNTVVCYEVLEHIVDLDQAMKNIVTCLADGGHLLLSLPFQNREHGEDYWRFTPKGHRLLISRHGLKFLKWTDVEHEGLRMSGVSLSRKV